MSHGLHSARKAAGRLLASLASAVRHIGTQRRSALARTTAALQESERQLAEKSRLLQMTLDHMGHGIQMIDAAGHVVVVNEQAIALLGVPAEMMRRRPHISEVATYQARTGELQHAPPQVTSNVGDFSYHQRPQHYRRKRPDGRMLEVESRPLPGGGMVRIHTDITERHAAEERVRFLAGHDTLTGLANRALFQDALQHALAAPAPSSADAAAEAPAVASLLLLDLDRFKEVNDTLGHPVGDSLLRAVAGRLRGCVGPSDVVARLGGDEFALIRLYPPDAMPAPDRQLADAQALAALVIDAISRPYELDGSQVVIGVSIGIALSEAGPEPPPDESTLLRQADLALYEAKADGRGTWQVFRTGLEERLLERRTLETDLRLALERQEFEVFYQPFIDLRSGALGGFEALLRWHHPVRGLLAPGNFIGAAESNGLIGPIGDWVLQRACADASAWPAHLRLAVNLSPVQFRNPHLADTVQAALEATGFAADRLELEITESVLMQNSETTLAALATLRALGASIALDDFGTGYSSLSYVRSFPFDTIKIDRSFVDGMGQRRDSDAIVSAVIGLARDLDIRTVAEGIETDAQLAALRLLGCSAAQGFLFSAARPVGELAQLIAEAAPALSLLPGLEMMAGSSQAAD